MSLVLLPFTFLGPQCRAEETYFLLPIRRENYDCFINYKVAYRLVRQEAKLNGKRRWSLPITTKDPEAGNRDSRQVSPDALSSQSANNSRRNDHCFLVFLITLIQLRRLYTGVSTVTQPHFEVKTVSAYCLSLNKICADESTHPKILSLQNSNLRRAKL